MIRPTKKVRGRILSDQVSLFKAEIHLGHVKFSRDVLLRIARFRFLIRMLSLVLFIK